MQGAQTVTLREFLLGDIPAIAAIRNESISISPDFYSMTVDRARYDYYDEDVPMRSRIMVAEEAGHVAGFYHLYTDEHQLARGRVNLDSIHVHPSYRDHGVGSALVNSVVDTATEWGGKYISTAIPEDSPGSLRFLERHGFQEVRRFFKMRLNDFSQLAAPTLPEGYSIRTFTPGQDEAAFVHVFNTAFEGHWDFTPLAEAEVAQWNKRMSFNPRGCFLLFDGDRMVGFMTVLYNPDQAAQTGEAVARIFEMGVLPEYRSKGLGFEMLKQAIGYAKDRGMKAVDLVTDAENEAAVKLYDKVGFQEKRATIVLHRTL
jgi:mycothiol synthase